MPTELQNQDNENQEDLDLAPALSEISAELFGQGGDSGDGGEVGQTGGEPDGDAHGTDPAPQTDKKQSGDDPLPADPAASPDNTEAVQETGAPKTWSKEALADWATIPPRAQQEILKREEDALRGISMYKQQAELGQSYDKVVEPYKPLLAAEQVDPVQLFQSFAANHYLLSRGTPEQKVQIAANLINGYGIDFAALVDTIGEAALAPVDPEIKALREKVELLERTTQTRQQQESEVLVSRAETEIAAFAKDPANPYFDEVVDDIQRLFASGQASTLQEAYDKAVWANPTTRAKELERITSEKLQSQSATEQTRLAKIARTQAADVSLDPKSANGTVPPGSIDDTLADTLARIQARA